MAARGESLWRPTPGRLAQVLAGEWLFGTGEALVVAAKLGNSPWTCLAQGVSLHTPLSIGVATQAIGFAVLFCWIPLRERPGIGTILNAIVIGVAIDVTLGYLPHEGPLALRVASMLGGIAVVGIGSGLYLTARLGPGPRDGLMTGLHKRYGLPLAVVRTVLELSVTLVGLALGARVGIGTLAFALLIGPAVAAFVRLIAPRADARALAAHREE
jgi:uncharacterized membrane protein YczE